MPFQFSNITNQSSQDSFIPNTQHQQPITPQHQQEAPRHQSIKLSQIYEVPVDESRGKSGEGKDSIQ